MALDKQRILGELGSVMKQLQSADCGCLGKLFGNSQQAVPAMTGNPLSSCGGCRRACCHGHGYCHESQSPMHQPPQTMNSMPVYGTDHSQQPMRGNMNGFGPQIVNMMRSDHATSQDPLGHGQGQMPAQLTSPMIIDAPQSPHGIVGLAPLTTPAMAPPRQFNPASMNQRDVTGQIQNQFMIHHHTNNQNNNTSNLNPIPQMSTPPSIMSPCLQEQKTSNVGAYHTSTAHNHQHGQHSEGIAKFHQMFPGIKQGLGGDLGFDPMAIAIQMNPDNHLQSAMDTMQKVMNNDKGMNRVPSNPQGDHQSTPITNGIIEQNVVPDKFAQSIQIPNQQATGQNIIDPNQMSQQNTMNTYGQPVHIQQAHTGTIDVSAGNKHILQHDNQHLQQYGQQKIINLNSGTPSLPVTYEETEEEMQSQVLPYPVQNSHSNEPQTEQIMKEPIFPVDTTKHPIYPVKEQKNYVYNTLGQPVEMLPAKLFHPTEPSLPQTLSPQPEKPVSNPFRAGNVKATVSKTSLMGNKPNGKTPSRTQLQRIYNQFKGSQSFTNQNVRHPGEGTHSDGRLNVPQGNTAKAPAVPVERVGGDTVANNPSSNQGRMAKVDQVLGQIGDVPTVKPGGDFTPEAPKPVGKCRNGLQDVVFTSYPSSAAWSFHGDGRNKNNPLSAHRYRNIRQY